jgi:hypothetical protein
MEQTSTEPARTSRSRQPARHGLAPGNWGLPPGLKADRLAWIVLAGLMAVAAAFLYHETRDTTFWFDEWDWVEHRRGNDLDSFLRGHNGHLSLVPVAIYKVLFAVAGLDDYAPYRMVLILAHLACVVLVFVYARRRVGNVVALLAATLILFLGPAWQDILWPFQMGWLISLAAGLGALLTLDREDRAGDGWSCILLGLSLASSSLGVPIALGLAVEALWGRHRWRDGWIVAAPLTLYALWWLGYHDSAFLRHNVVLTPGFVADGIAASLAALTGLAGPTVPDGAGTLLDWGRPLAIAAAALLIWRVARVGTVPVRVLVLILTPLSFWILTALNRAQISPPFSSRYVYVGAFFVVLLAVELARGTRVQWRAGLLIGLAVAAATVANVGLIRDGGRFLRGSAEATTAGLGALELGRPKVDRDFVAQALPGSPFVIVTAGAYFAAADELGSPAASASEIAAQSEGARRVADTHLMDIHGVELEPSAGDVRAVRRPVVDSVVGGEVRGRGPCAAFRPAGVTSTNAGSGVEVTVPRTGLLVTAIGGPARVGVRRFADRFQSLGTLAPSRRAAVRIGPDLAPQPWRLRVTTSERASVCTIR